MQLDKTPRQEADARPQLRFSHFGTDPAKPRHLKECRFTSGVAIRRSYLAPWSWKKTALPHLVFKVLLECFTSYQLLTLRYLFIKDTQGEKILNNWQ